MGTVTLHPGHVRPVWAGHPWVFAQAVARLEGGATPGDEVDVVDPRGSFLGRGLYSPRSAILVRIYSRERGVHCDGRLLTTRIESAIARRALVGLPAEHTTGYRLVHAEGDDLPGLIVDRFGDCLAIQLGTVGMSRRRGQIVDVLHRLLNPRMIVDRTPERTAELEGFTIGERLLLGEAEPTLRFRERGLQHEIPTALTQKTGYYFDQRPLRALVEVLATGKRVLDTYCYTGSLALSAARGGAKEVRGVDQSAAAIEVAADCARLNGLEGLCQFVCGPAHEALAHAGRSGGWDLVICDPPKLAPNRAAAKKALQNMRQVAGEAARATRRGGLLALCSCSAAIGMDDLTRALALGARDMGLGVTLMDRLYQGPDHPVPAAFPEGLYLSTVVAEIRQL
jgi:23S rRNA (cytosine1962-C5)-methyltransferase